MDFGRTGETLRMAADSLRANRLRSLLTILGVVIGVATVIIISSIITGLNNKVANFAKSFGTDSIFVFHLPVDVRPTAEMLARKRLTVDEAYDMRQLPHVVAVDPAIRYQDPNFNIGQESVKYGSKSVQQTLLEGDTDQLLGTTGISMKEGAMFTNQQDKSRSNVAVLGYDTADKLFGHESPLGKDVQIKGELFTVIGVVNKQAQLFGSGPNPQDNIVFMPLGTFRKIMPDQKDVWITVRYDSAKNESLVEDEIRTLLRIARKVTSPSSLPMPSCASGRSSPPGSSSS
jgi:putative ABC transport system permease protein